MKVLTFEHLFDNIAIRKLYISKASYLITPILTIC